MPEEKKDPTVHFIAGAVSALVSCVALQPFDLIKTRIQQQKQNHLLVISKDGRRLNPLNSTIVSTVKEITRKDSVLGLWRGTVPTILRNVPGQGLYFLTLSEIRRLFSQRRSISSAKVKSDESVSLLPVLSKRENLIAGMTARATVGFIMMPITVVKVRYESNIYNYKSIWEALISIVRNEGVKGLFAGYGATAIRDAPQAGLYILFYENAKTKIGEWKTTNSYSIASPVIHMSSAIFASVAATVTTQPFDMLKTRMQLKPYKYSNTWQSARLVFKEEGIIGFFDGLTLRLARKTIQSAIVWTMYEEIVKRILKLNDN